MEHKRQSFDEEALLVSCELPFSLREEKAKIYFKSKRQLSPESGQSVIQTLVLHFSHWYQRHFFQEKSQSFCSFIPELDIKQKLKHLSFISIRMLHNI